MRCPVSRCEACGTEGGGLVLDHDHQDGGGDLRGWICDRCNLVLGQVGDDPELLEDLAGYLRDRMQRLTSASVMFGG